MQQPNQPSNVGADVATFKCKYCPAIVPDDWYHRWKHISDNHKTEAVGIRLALAALDGKAASCAQVAREGLVGYADSIGGEIGFRSGVGPEIDAAATEFLQSNR